MRKHVALAALLLLVLGALTFATAQQNSQSKDESVRITKGPVVEYVDDKSAVIAWSTNVPGGTTVMYGTNPGQLTQSAKAPWGGVTHRVNINGLQPNTQYYFDVQTGQAAGSGTEAGSSMHSFKTTSPGQKQNYPNGRQ